jgi:hypothetical protein
MERTSFYPIPFGHVEMRVDRRPQRPPRHALAERPKR